MARDPYAEATATDALLSETLGPVPHLNTFRMFANLPELAAPCLSQTRALLTNSFLAPDLREAAILQIARDCECPYMAHQHRRLALEVGLDAQVVETILAGAPVSAAPHDLRRLVRTAASEAVSQHGISAATFDALVEQTSHHTALAITPLIAHYVAEAVFLKSTEVDLEA